MLYGSSRATATSTRRDTLSTTSSCTRQPAEGRRRARFALPSRVASAARSSAAGSVAGQLVASGQAIMRGDVVPLPAPLPGGLMTSLYAGLPVYFDDDFSVTVENGSDVAIVWLIPITAEETAFIREKGWEAFEEALVRQDPDLLDPDRPQLDL
ncbi:suppressor of fused domain protein [Streptomyces hokutonensis]|uniref:suppressor of fused domain protein n=1 Tax=Streptomyces hokutonensis TaxID=1306990 RepID=UPI0036A48680